MTGGSIGAGREGRRGGGAGREGRRGEGRGGERGKMWAGEGGDEIFGNNTQVNRPIIISTQKGNTSSVSLSENHRVIRQERGGIALCRAWSRI